MLRQRARSMAIVCSVADMMLAVGALMTRMPRAVQASTSTLSSPTPARPMIVEDLAQAGIRVNITRHSVGDARKPLQTPGHGNVFCGNWYADFPDSDNFFFIFFHSHSSAVAGLNFHTDDMDRQIETARMSNDVEERANIYRKLDEAVVR